MYCSPTKKRYDFTCFSFNQLKTIANAYNLYLINNERLCFKSQCINIVDKPISISKKTKKDLYNSLYKRLIYHLLN